MNLPRALVFFTTNFNANDDKLDTSPFLSSQIVGVPQPTESYTVEQLKGKKDYWFICANYSRRG